MNEREVKLPEMLKSSHNRLVYQCSHRMDDFVAIGIIISGKKLK